MDIFVRVMVDFGVIVNVLSKRDFDNLRLKLCLIDMNVKVYLYMFIKSLDLRGKFRVNVVSDYGEL